MKDEIIQTLLDEKIVKLSADKPFQFASGMLSPVYTDLRMTISYPKLRSMIADGIYQLISAKFSEVTVIGGVATAGIPHAAWVAERADLPMIYVRSKPKDHGTGKQIEGKIEKSDQVVLIDDLISTGGSVIQAAQAVQREGYDVIGVVSIFSYQFPDAVANFSEAKIPFVPLLTYSDVIEKGNQEGKFTEDEFKRLTDWHQDPWSWMKKEEK